MPYNINGEPVDENQGTLFVGVFVFLVVIFGLVLYLSQPKQLESMKHDSLTSTLTNDGSYMYWYVLIDPETGVEYLVNSRGGCTPRLNTGETQAIVPD